MNIVGTCSICGGRVMVPTVYHSVVPPIPSCESCKAIAATSGPVIPMTPLKGSTNNWSSTNQDPNEGKPTSISIQEMNKGKKRLLNG